MGMLLEKRKDNLQVRVYSSREEMGAAAAAAAADCLRSLLEEKETVNAVFAAAPSQNETLDALAQEPGIDWNRVNAFHMDEYVGLDPRAPQAFGQFLRDRLFGKVKFKSVNYIKGTAADIEAECARYSRALRKAKPDIVCMGIGENGHIAFNDPHEAFFFDSKAVKVVTLDEKCRMQQVHDGCFDSLSLVPTHAVTLTIPSLMAPEYVFCVVPAPTKADAVYTMLKGEIGEYCPCTVLRRHGNSVLYTDKDSAKRILV